MGQHAGHNRMMQPQGLGKRSVPIHGLRQRHPGTAHAQCTPRIAQPALPQAHLCNQPRALNFTKKLAHPVLLCGQQAAPQPAARWPCGGKSMDRHPHHARIEPQITALRTSLARQPYQGYRDRPCDAKSRRNRRSPTSLIKICPQGNPMCLAKLAATLTPAPRNAHGLQNRSIRPRSACHP